MTAPTGLTSAMALRARTARASSNRRRRGGFTLIELMVAMSAGLAVAAGAFLLARNASLFFQSEARLTNAQFASMVGMTRLTSDVRRASYKSSPNAKRDPNVCGYTSTWPSALKDLSGIRIVEGGSKADHPGDHTLSSTNNLNPDALYLTGLMNSTEHFSVALMQAAGTGGYDIYLNLDGAYWRTKLATQSGSNIFDNIFVVGGMLRLVDQEGRATYGVISGVDESGTKPRITVSGTPKLAKRETQKTCGCTGLCLGSLVNSISTIKYDLRKVDTTLYTRYAGMFPKANVNGSKPTQFKGEVEPDRTELVRVALDVDGKEINDTLEVVAEYAVDLKFGATRTDLSTNVNQTPNLTRLAIGDKKVYEKNASINNGGSPEYTTAVQVRLSTRAPVADRIVGLPTTDDGGLLRFSLGTDVGYARMRTLVSDVFLSNQAGVSW
jgi:prepilin-type N-terminal cleavage/methylation domain-containing protein